MLASNAKLKMMSILTGMSCAVTGFTPSQKVRASLPEEIRQMVLDYVKVSLYTHPTNCCFFACCAQECREFRDGTATGAFRCQDCLVAAMLGCYELYIGVAWQSKLAMEN